MAYWAELDNNNKVIQVTVGDDNSPEGDKGYQWLIDNLGGTWIECDYYTVANKNVAGMKALRKNYPGPGWTYDPEKDGFYAPQPFPSWILNQETFIWEAPTPLPTEPGSWIWDEEQVQWVDLSK